MDRAEGFEEADRSVKEESCLTEFCDGRQMRPLNAVLFLALRKVEAHVSTTLLCCPRCYLSLVVSSLNVGDFVRFAQRGS